MVGTLLNSAVAVAAVALQPFAPSVLPFPPFGNPCDCPCTCLLDPAFDFGHPCVRGELDRAETEPEAGVGVEGNRPLPSLGDRGDGRRMHG